MADRELRRFFAYQLAEARKLGYPRQAAFAKHIARGTLGPSPPTEDDPVMDVVGRFYWSIREIDRRILSERYAGIGTDKDRARAVGISVRSLYRKVDALLSRLKYDLQFVA